MNNPFLEKHRGRCGPNEFEYVVQGEGEPAVVLLGGAGMEMFGWFRVFPPLAEHTRVFVYNRLGIGKSSKADGALDGVRIVQDMRSLLMHADIRPPFILVGHSVGGLYANLFARMYPADVAGVVMVDATHPDEPERMKTVPRSFIARGLERVLKGLSAIGGSKEPVEADFVEETTAQIASASPFPNVPLTVVTGTKKMLFVPRASFEAHLACQRELPTLSSQSKQVIAAGSGHFPHITEPNIVVEAIRELIDQQRLKALEVSTSARCH